MYKHKRRLFNLYQTEYRGTKNMAIEMFDMERDYVGDITRNLEYKMKSQSDTAFIKPHYLEFCKKNGIVTEVLGYLDGIPACVIDTKKLLRRKYK